MITTLFLFIAQINIKAEDVGLPKIAANDATLGNIASATMVVVGAISLLYLLIGAFRYVIAGEGGKDKANIVKAKNTILYAIIGMVVSSLAFVIVQFILGRLF